GSRSSTAVAKCIWMEAAKAGGDPAVAEGIDKEKNWRQGYVDHVVRVMMLSALSRSHVLKTAAAGLKAAHESFTFVRGDQELPLAAAMELHAQHKFVTGVVKGGGAPHAQSGSFPLNGKMMPEDDAKSQVQRWADYGCIEADAAQALKESIDSVNKIDLSRHCFILLGATSELGPLKTLMRHGGTAIGVSRNSPSRWRNLLDVVKQGSGQIIFPMNKEARDEEQKCEAAGCDLLVETPEILQWLKEEAICDKFDSVTVGCYLYLDGEAHVRASVAMDLIVTGLVEEGKKKGKKISVAYLGSPSTCVAIPQECYDASVKAQHDAPFWQKMLFLKPKVVEKVTTDTGETIYLNNGFVVLQGPNYALAKTLQMWRAMLLREEEKLIVSTNIAPGSRTLSVTHNTVLSSCLDGQGHFKPLLTFEAPTASEVLALLLLHDVFSSSSITHPSKALTNPLLLFSKKAVHGGLWRSPWQPESIGTAA
ncbi:hypothetical protein GUITHDRAFT_46452, partial [Guillardia theta CCMP2712]